MKNSRFHGGADHPRSPGVGGRGQAGGCLEPPRHHRDTFYCAFGDDDHLNEAVESLAETCRDHYGYTFGQDYKKDRNVDYWRSLSTIVVGGGSLIPRLRDVYARKLPGRSFCEVGLLNLSGLVERSRLTTVGRESGAAGPPVIPALGLSTPEPLMREFVPPVSIEDSRPPVSTPSSTE